jgi:hypothetical protein
LVSKGWVLRFLSATTYSSVAVTPNVSLRAFVGVQLGKGSASLQASDLAVLTSVVANSSFPQLVVQNSSSHFRAGVLNFLLIHANRSHRCVLLILHIWRGRVEVESTIRPAKGRIAGFEGREGHRTPFAPARRISSLPKTHRREKAA